MPFIKALRLINLFFGVNNHIVIIVHFFVELKGHRVEHYCSRGHVSVMAKTYVVEISGNIYLDSNHV